MLRSIALEDSKPNPKWLMPDAVWKKMERLLPDEKPKGKKTRGGRPCVDLRRVLDAIFYVLRTSCQWKALPRSLGSGSTAHRYFQTFCQAGVFERLWRKGLHRYDVLKGIRWQWQAMDETMTKAPLAVRR
jgi:transposase